jgi:hypothetical protein
MSSNVVPMVNCSHPDISRGLDSSQASIAAEPRGLGGRAALAGQLPGLWDEVWSAERGGEDSGLIFRAVAETKKVL